jgi:NhaA family Na+:H+ antiporter
MAHEPDNDDIDRPIPPEAPLVRRWARRIARPIEAFLRIEASSGIVLLAMAAIALGIASSRWERAFHRLLDAPLAFERSAHFVINDVLMTIFFFVVGLEIRREIHEGELSTPRRAALPLAAAVGGMIAPALLYLLVAGSVPENRRGWGVPMATDIAFAVGVLAILGKRVPPALRVLLLALAIIDDIGGIVIIALFYSGAVSILGFVVALVGVGGILLMQRLGVRRPALYVIPGAIVWFGIYRSGVHPTLAGVVVGLLTPVGPATRLQPALHPWVAFAIMPLFALANAGVALHGDAATPSLLGLGIVVGLVVGKPIGILAACAGAVKLGIASLPRGIGWREIFVVGLVAGIGFTMALFIADLAFADEARLEQGKAAILLGSTLAIVVGLTGGRLLLRPTPAASAATCESEAEASDEV